MEKTLRRFVPLIKFYHIKSKDFLDKVYPLKKLLPDDLINDLMIFHIAPDRKLDIQPPRKFDSTLIKRKHFAVFASWIDKKSNSHYNDPNNTPYKFNLIYRASRDGKYTYEFQSKCH